MLLRNLAGVLFLVLLAASFGAGAIVIRDDVSDAEYRVSPSELPALADMPGEGHGVLIAPQWVVTAAHAVTWQAEIKDVVIGGVARKVERLLIHPGYKKLPQDLIDQALSSGDATRVMAFLASSDDIALLKLAAPVTGIAPLALYESSDELGKTVEILGKGATGTGARGHDPKGPNRTELRRAFNRISRVDERWVCYAFDQPPQALPLEGMSGNGDSGGPVLIQTEGDWRVAGLASWKIMKGDIRTSRPGTYGQSSCNVRLSHYVDWIQRNIAPAAKTAGSGQGR